MNLNEIQDLIKFVSKSGDTEVEIEKKDYILCVGRLERVKGFDLAIEGFAGISKGFSTFRLILVGD